MKIAIASGKGGTGKTTVAVNLALTAPGPVELLDGDVEEPNVHLFLRPDLPRRETVTVPKPEIDPARCTKCSACAAACRYHAILSIGGRPLVFPNLCHGCGGCARVCPTGALREVPRTVGVVESGTAGSIAFAHGVLEVGGVLVPPLIRAVLRRAGRAPLSLVDCPPGASCAMVTAVRGSDAVVLVAEPTAFGRNDLELAALVLADLGIPHGVVINRAGSGDDRVAAFCASRGLPILGEIPDDREVARAYARGQPAVRAVAGMRERFEALHRTLASFVRDPSSVRVPTPRGESPDLGSTVAVDAPAAAGLRFETDTRPGAAERPFDEPRPGDHTRHLDHARHGDEPRPGADPRQGDPAPHGDDTPPAPDATAPARSGAGTAPIELVVLSGKGGTGKTSIAASLAVLAGQPVVADCDVDAADLFLLFPPRVRVRRPFVGGLEARIRPEDCTGCEACVPLCRFEAIHREHGRVAIDPFACEGCGVCADVCPTGAVELSPATVGEWFRSETRVGSMVHARLRPGGENSGKLVATVREEARTVAAETGNSPVLGDGPPGIGCQVISALTGAGYALLVTEPTIAGQHDLDRLLGLVRHFGIRAGVCVNRWDLDRELSAAIERRAALSGAPVIGRIRYDPAFTRAQLQGRTVVEATSDAADDVRALWRRLVAEGAVGRPIEEGSGEAPMDVLG
jgi:MinD superfamily P-loop ATPase